MEKKTSGEWLRHFGLPREDILDPDGWDRKNFQVSWNEKIDLKEFQKRLRMSTVNHIAAIDRAFRGGK